MSPLSLSDVVELVLLMSPYWPILEEHLPRLDRALIAKDRSLLSEVFFVLREKMSKAPGDIIKAVSLLAGVDPIWVAQKATAQEIVEALPVLDKVHDLRRLWRVVQEGRVYLDVAK